jgi:hypothetical protein
LNPSVFLIKLNLFNRYIAKYEYLPNEDDEIDLRKGDLVLVYKMCEDGWFIGLSSRSGKFGSLPGNYVRPTNQNETINASARKYILQ